MIVGHILEILTCQYLNRTSIKYLSDARTGPMSQMTLGRISVRSCEAAQEHLPKDLVANVTTMFKVCSVVCYCTPKLVEWVVCTHLFVCVRASD